MLPGMNAQGPNEDPELSSMRISAVPRAREREGKAGMEGPGMEDVMRQQQEQQIWWVVSWTCQQDGKVVAGLTARLRQGWFYILVP